MSIANLPKNPDGSVKAGPGRKKGSSNKKHELIREAVRIAGTKAGGRGGLVAYLKWLAKAHPAAFASILTRAMPLQVQPTGGGNRVVVEIVRHDGEQTVQVPVRQEPKLIDVTPDYTSTGRPNGRDPH